MSYIPDISRCAWLALILDLFLLIIFLKSSIIPIIKTFMAKMTIYQRNYECCILLASLKAI
jgi:hypothetical protein